MALKLFSNSKCFGGEQRVYTHQSEALGCKMKFGVYIPPAIVETTTKFPVLYVLSGFGATHEEFILRSGFQRFAEKHGIIVVNPDTAPRGLTVARKNDSCDFATNSGMYVDATEAPWKQNYKMYTYVTRELVDLVNSNLPVLPNKRGIMGHSMGGHGALICALKNPGLYKSVSTFAALVNPSKNVSAKRAFSHYLGPNEESWKAWDGTDLASAYAGPPLKILTDQGGADNFLLQKALLPENFLAAASSNDRLEVIYKLREGYDHGFFYISTFIEEHFEYHAKILKA